MNPITIYTQSLNHLGERIFISQIIKDNDITEDINILNNPQISEEDLAEINKLIRSIKPGSSITIYTLSAYQSKRNNLKDKWINTTSGQELVSLMSNYNITLKTYNKNQENFKNNLIKKMTLFHNTKLNKNKSKKITTSTPSSSIINIKLSEGKIYNFNDNICNVVNIYLRGSCNIEDSKKPGCYTALISKNNKELILKGNAINTTTNKMLLTGLIEATKVLKKPCLIKLYTHTYLGFSSVNVNFDLKKEFFTIIKANNHAVVETVTNEKQDYLKSLQSDN